MLKKIFKNHCPMKTIFKSFVLIVAATFTLSACSQKENLEQSNPNEQVTLRFNIRNADDAAVTKALLGAENGKNFLNWEDGDQIGTFSVGSFASSQTTSNNNPGTVQVSGDSYTLNVQTYNTGDITNIYSYFPHSASAGKNKTAAIVSIPESQTMTNSGFDADAMPMAGEPITVDITTTAANTDTPCGTINFSNLGSIIKFRVFTSTSTTETLTSVTYKATNIGGAFTIDLTGVDATDETSLLLTASDAVSEITTAYPAHPAIATGAENAIDVYMVVAPGSYTGSQVVVTTNEHTYTLDASGEKTFTRSHVKPMKIDISKGTQGDLPTPETWTKVTKASDFTAGTYYILRGDGAYYLPNAVASSGAPACVAPPTDGSITNAMKWTATASDGGLTFESVANAGNYLWGANTNNGVRVTTTSTASGASKVWHFTTTTVSSTTYYTAYAYATRYLTSYGDQDWRNYTSASSTNIPAEFYKLDVVDNRTAVTLSFAAATIEKTTDDYDEFTGQVATASPNESAITSNISYALTGDVIGTVNASTGAVALDGTVGTATITASFSGDASFKPATASYEITVVNANANDGSASKPYTASEAVDVASASGFTDRDNVYVKGIVCTTGTISSGAVSYYISDDGTTTKKFEAYKGKYISGADFTESTNLKLGDYVVACGTLTYYSGGSQAEFAQGSQVISVLRAPSFSPADGSFSTSTLSVTITADAGSQIYYTTDESEPTTTTGTLYTSAISISASTVIKAIAIKDGVSTGVVSKTYTKSSGGQNVTLQYTGDTTGNFGTGNVAATVGLSATDWSVIASQGSASNNVGYNKAHDIRLYYNASGSNTLTVSSLNNATINYITITYTGSSYSNGKVLVGGNEVAISSGSYPINSTSFAITNGNTSNVQVRISSIVINYTPAD